MGLFDDDAHNRRLLQIQLATQQQQAADAEKQRQAQIAAQQQADADRAAQQQEAARAEAARQLAAQQAQQQDAARAEAQRQADIAARDEAARTQQTQSDADARANATAAAIREKQDAAAAQEAAQQKSAAAAAAADEQAKQQAAADTSAAAERDRQAQAAIAEQKRQDEIAARNTRRQGALGSAKKSAFDALHTRGLDTLDDLVGGALQARYDQADPNAELPDDYFANIADNTLLREEGNRRAGFQNAVSKFASPGFENSRITDTMDDPYISDIASKQFDAARGKADVLKARGAVTDEGYNAALQSLTGQQPGVNSRLQDLGQSFLKSGRGRLSDIGSSANAAAGNYKLGDTFDPETFRTQIESAFGDFNSHLNENIMGAAPKDLFDTTDLLNIAGMRQGARNSNTVGGELNTDFEAENKKKKQDAGSTGVF